MSDLEALESRLRVRTRLTPVGPFTSEAVADEDCIAAADAIRDLRASLTAVTAERDRLKHLIEAQFDCLPGCSSFGHAASCATYIGRMTDYRRAGLSVILLAAADHLDLHARIMAGSYKTRSGQWDRSCPGMREEHDDKRALAKALRRAAAYAKPNPLGGPATALESCADQIRAGVPYDEALADFGLRRVG